MGPWTQTDAQTPSAHRRYVRAPSNGSTAHIRAPPPGCRASPQYRGTLPAGLLDIAELEWHASRVRTVQFMHVPRLLETEDYARGVFAAVLPPLSRLEVELRVAHRMARQRVRTLIQDIRAGKANHLLWLV